MGPVGRQQGTFQKSLRLVIKSDLFIGNRPVSQSRNRGPDRALRPWSHVLSQLIRSMGEIAGKQLIRTLSAQADRRPGFAELGEKPDRKGSSVRAGLIAVIGKFLDRPLKVHLRMQIKLLMLDLVMIRHLPDVFRLIEGTSVKGN